MRKAVVSLLVVVLFACSQQSTAGPRTGPVAATGPQERGALKRIVAIVRSSPPSLFLLKTQRGGGLRGLDGIEELTNAGLSHIEPSGARTPQLAEAVPSIENGLWKVLPDGRMETTWRLKPGVKWQDGTPLTTEDLIFTTVVEQDKELEIQSLAEYELIESLQAPDPRTIVVLWKKPYIEADSLFSYAAAGMPLPKHLLGPTYAEDKTSFASVSYWTEDFVGLGAFRIREWERDSHLIAQAFDGYALGRPKIDEVQVKFIPDNNAILANMLAGADLTLGKTISLDIALQARDQWKDGHVEVRAQNWTPINPQFINPDPPIIADYRFRKALMLALDRQQLADFVFSGYGSIAHSYVSPNEPLYNLVEPSIVKYEFDPRQSSQILEGLGYTKRGDGALYEAAGNKLTVSIRIPVQNDIHLKTAAPVADYWQQIGVTTEQVPVPIQRALDREWRSEYGGFEVVERVNSLLVGEIWRFHSSMVPLPENGYRQTGFSGRYRHPDVDAALERYATTIPLPDRMRELASLVHHQTENLSQLPLFHGADPTLVSNRLLNITARGESFTQPWNVQEWDLR